ncbi:MAG: matrixin family metalloprotease [Proteobacteria bacterium]|nr:matrixin family metalloprotease [Pseudomonadota bacterium]
MRKLFLSLMFMTFGISEGLLADNGSSTHGGDVHLDEDNPWFLYDVRKESEPRPMNVCIAQDGNAPSEQLVQMVSRGIGEWVAFFKKYELDKNGFPRVMRKMNEPEFVREDAELRLNLKFSVYKGADIPANSMQFLCDLSIFFSAKKGEAHRVGVATRNDSGLRGGGAPELNRWSYPGKIGIIVFEDAKITYHVLLHELGHMFGMAHNSVAIMDENTVDRAVRGIERHIGAIESPTWKLVLKAGDSIDFNAKKQCAEGLVEGARHENMSPYSKRHEIDFQKLIGFDIGSRNICLGFKLDYLSKRKDPTDGLVRDLALTIVAPNNQKITLKGKAKIADYSFAGPSLYAGFVGEASEPSVIFAKRYAKIFDNGYLTEGYFELNGQKIPMTLNFYVGPENSTDLPYIFGGKGPRLNLLNPKTFEWMIIK